MNVPESERTRLSVGSCPRCGRTLSGLGSTGGVCLGCLGARIFDPASSDPWPLAHASSPLERLGPYELIEELGRGGMAKIYAAHHTGLGRIVALKVITCTGPQGEELSLRFVREAQTLARLQHPNVVGVHDAGSSGSQAYLAMTYIEGGDLARRLKSGPLPAREAAQLVRKIAAALAYVHREGVIHRDLKPSNILLEGDEPIVADFGLAAETEADAGLTVDTKVLGTPHYLAPEALSGGSQLLSVATDLYALGVILYEALTGRTPFAGARAAELPALVANQEPPSPRLFAPGLSADLETICLKSLDRDPGRRYESAAALAEDLRRFGEGEPILARPLPWWEQFWRACKRRPALGAIWVLSGLVAVGSTVAALWIAHERSQVQDALASERSAEASEKEQVRQAKFAEAKALCRTSLPGRREEALRSLGQAARIRPGRDLRDQAVAAMLLMDVSAESSTDLHWETPHAVNFAGNGRLLSVQEMSAFGGDRSAVEVRPWGAVSPVARLAVQGVAIAGSAAYSPAADRVLIRGADESIRAWRLTEAKPYLMIEHRSLPCPEVKTDIFNTDYAFSADGKSFFLGLAPHGLTLHDAEDGRERARFDGGQRFTTLRADPTGARVAALRAYHDGAAPKVFILSAKDLTLERTLDTPEQPQLLAWSRDGRILVVALWDNTLCRYDVRDGRLLQRVTSSSHDPYALELVGEDSYAAQRASDSILHITNLDLGRDELDMPGQGPDAIGVADRGGSILTATIPGVVTRWKVLPPVGFRAFPPPRSAGYEFGADQSLDFSADGQWAYTAVRGYTLVRNVGTGRLAIEIDNGVTAAKDFGSLVVSQTGYPGDIFWCNGSSPVLRFPVRPTADGSLVADKPEVVDSEPGYLITARDPAGKRLLMLSPNSGKLKVLEWDGHAMATLGRWTTPGAYAGAFSPDGTRVIVNCDGIGPGARQQKLQAYDARTGSVVATLHGPVSCDVAWSNDGRSVLTSNGMRQSILWDATTWTRRATVDDERGGNMTTFALAPQGDLAVIASDTRIHVMSLADGKDLVGFEVPGATGLAVELRFLPDGHRFGVLWRDGRLDIFDLNAIRDELKRTGLDW